MAYSPVMTIAELDAFFEEHFPQAISQRKVLTRHEEIRPGALRMRRIIGEHNLRPGGTVSGPTMMSLADHAVFALIISHIGPVALAVTTSLTINFLRKPAPTDLIAEARFKKLGSRLAIGDVDIFSDGQDEPVAHAVVTYSIPPKTD